MKKMLASAGFWLNQTTFIIDAFEMFIIITMQYWHEPRQVWGGRSALNFYLPAYFPLLHCVSLNAHTIWIECTTKIIEKKIS